MKFIILLHSHLPNYQSFIIPIIEQVVYNTLPHQSFLLPLHLLHLDTILHYFHHHSHLNHHFLNTLPLIQIIHLLLLLNLLFPLPLLLLHIHPHILLLLVWNYHLTIRLIRTLAAILNLATHFNLLIISFIEFFAFT